MDELNWDFERENKQFAEGIVSKCRSALNEKDWENVEFYYKMILNEFKYVIARYNEFGFRSAYTVFEEATSPNYDNNITSTLARIHPNVEVAYAEFCIGLIPDFNR